MAKPSRKDTFIYLCTCSHRSLGDFLLSRLDQHSQLKKELLVSLERLIDILADNLADIRIANLLRDHGEEIVERLASPQQLTEQTPESIPPQRVMRTVKIAKKA